MYTYRSILLKALYAEDNKIILTNKLRVTWSLSILKKVKIIAIISTREI